MCITTSLLCLPWHSSLSIVIICCLLYYVCMRPFYLPSAVGRLAMTRFHISPALSRIYDKIYVWTPLHLRPFFVHQHADTHRQIRLWHVPRGLSGNWLSAQCSLFEPTTRAWHFHNYVWFRFFFESVSCMERSFCFIFILHIPTTVERADGKLRFATNRGVQSSLRSTYLHTLLKISTS